MYFRQYIFANTQLININRRGNLIYYDYNANMVLKGEGLDVDDYNNGPCKGWHKYITREDSVSFGIWDNQRLRQIFCLCNYTPILIVCKTTRSFTQELEHVRRYFDTPLEPKKLFEDT